ncbi:hypothetical protein D3C85_13950 [compost metagenome]
MEGAVVLDDHKQDLADKLADLGREFLKEGYYQRLVVTDDILSFKDTHTRAKEGGDEFFFGVTLPDRLQVVVDGFIRDDKERFIELIENDQAHHEEFGIAVEFDAIQQAYLVKIVGCGMGFFISKTVHTPRHLRPSRMTMGKLSKLLNSGERNSGRRKMVLGSTAVI